MRLAKNASYLLFAIILILFFLLSPFLIRDNQDGQNRGTLLGGYASDSSLSSWELRNRDSRWTGAEGSILTTDKSYAYGWIRIENDSEYPETYYLINRGGYYPTELLKPEAYGAVAFPRSSPVSGASAMWGRRVFSVILPPYGTADVIMEMNNRWGIRMDPLVLERGDWFERVLAWNISLGILLGLILLIGPVVLLFPILRGPGIADGDIRPFLLFLPSLFFASEVLLFYGGIAHSPAALFRAPAALILFLLLFLAHHHRLKDGGTRKIQEDSDDPLRLSERNSLKQLSLIDTLSSAVLQRTYTDIMDPLERIIALSELMAQAGPKDGETDNCRRIGREAENIRRIFIRHISESSPPIPDMGSPMAEIPAGEDLFGPEDSDRPGEGSTRIGVFISEKDKSDTISLPLRAAGFATIRIYSYEELSLLIKKGSVNLLVMDPQKSGKRAFELCRRIRKEWNIFEFPILMVAPFYAGYFIEKGFYYGVNDFAIRPLNGDELSARVLSLINLSQIYGENIKLAESENEKRMFIYFLTHNVNTPLTLLLNEIRDLKSLSDPGETEELLSNIQDSANEINDIVQNVLITFRLSDDRLICTDESVPPVRALKKVIDQIAPKAEKKRQSLRWTGDDSLPPVKCDGQSLKGILYNLIDNAVKFSPRNGHIRIDLSRTADRIAIRIGDDGPGIPKDKQPLLFNRFEPLNTRPTGGEASTGLGLYVAHELSRLNGGVLEYSDRDGGGACFTLTLECCHD